MEDFNKKVRQVINFFIAIFIFALIVTIICLIMLKYDVEGENNMPFELSQLVVVSTAEGINIEGESTWNLELVQNNDVYLHISKNKNYKETEIIKNIKIDNFKIKNMNKGKITIYKQSKDENKMYEYLDEYIIKDNLNFQGSEKTNTKELQISNQGGVVSFRICNKNLGKYSTDDEEIKHDGTILAKAGLGYDDIRFKVSFDLTIELVSGTKYTGTILLDLPTENIIQAGTTNIEKTDFSDVVFKRN